jgi:hypothetical protein
MTTVQLRPSQSAVRPWYTIMLLDDLVAASQVAAVQQRNARAAFFTTSGTNLTELPATWASEHIRGHGLVVCLRFADIYSMCWGLLAFQEEVWVASHLVVAATTRHSPAGRSSYFGGRRSDRAAALAINKVLLAVRHGQPAKAVADIAESDVLPLLAAMWKDSQGSLLLRPATAPTAVPMIPVHH